MINEDNNNPLDLSRYLQFGITIVLIVIGFFYLVKNTAAKWFEDYGDEVDTSERMPGLVTGCDSCAVCGRGTTKQCARCKAVKYCSASCQRSHWFSGHKENCDALGLSSKSSLQRWRNSGSIALVPCTGNSTQIKKILFPYDEFVELFNWKQQGFPPCGLLNCGNSCFANVVLQCLTYTRPLAAYLLEKGHRRECRRNGWCFLCELQAHMERACRSNHAFSPINILSRLPNIGGNLGYGKQEDAHEFMRFAIDTMQSVCLDEYGGERAVHPSSQETTLIQHIFGGRLQSQVICTNCNNVSNQFENMMDLTVEIHGDAASLEDCLDQFTVKEWLEGDNKYKCDGCNDYVLAWKRLNINMAPNILTIALKRFQSGRFGKLNKRVAFPETLDLSPYMSEVADGNDKYMLYGVVVHVDMLNASFFGHYICYMKDFSGNWYRIDDCKVDSVEVDEVLSQGAYMLLYSRVSARRSCLKPIVETSKKEELKKSNMSQENTLVVSQPLDCTLTAESADTASECGMDLSPVLTSPKPSDSAMDIHTVDTKGDDEVCDNNGVVPIKEATLPIEDNNCFTETSPREHTEVCISENDSIQNHVSDDIQNASSSSNGEDANGMDSTYLGCKPEKPKSTVTSATDIKDESRKPVKAKLKPGFLGKPVNDPIQKHVSDNIQNASSSSNGEDANGMDSTFLGCKPEKPKSTVTSATGIKNESVKPVKAKPKPLFAPGFLGNHVSPRNLSQPCSTQNDPIQNHVNDNIQNASSSSNGEDANGMASTYLGCKPEKPKSTVTSATSRKPVNAKVKPLFAPGFLGKRPRKILNTTKDAPVNGFTNIDIAESNGDQMI